MRSCVGRFNLGAHLQRNRSFAAIHTAANDSEFFDSWFELIRPVYRFFAADFFAVDLRLVPFRELLFFDVDDELFLVPVLLDGVLLLLAAFFPLPFPCGFGGISAPDRRASLNPIAIACFGFLTCFPLRPDFSS
jgi:hypothetical protein